METVSNSNNYSFRLIRSSITEQFRQLSYKEAKIMGKPI